MTGRVAGFDDVESGRDGAGLGPFARGQVQAGLHHFEAGL